MARGLPQQVIVVAEIVSPYPDQPPTREQRVLEETTHKNLRSKIKEWVDSVLIRWSCMSGAKIEITVGKAAEDEFARPDPE